MISVQHPHLIADLQAAITGDPFWEGYLASLNAKSCCSYSVHLAVMVEPFLQYLLDRQKTVESRFSINRCAPYNRVERGDVILLKQSGGPIVGLCQVSNRWFYQLDSSSREFIKQKFAKSLCAESPHFWEERERAMFATLIRVRHVRLTTPIKLEKRDRRGWVVLQTPTSPLLTRKD